MIRAGIDVDVNVDIDTIGRKELQALAKQFGLKANQKSAILRDELRETIAIHRRKENDLKDKSQETMSEEDKFFETKEDLKNDEKEKDDQNISNEEDLAGTEKEDDDNLVSDDKNISNEEDLVGTEKEDGDNLVSDVQNISNEEDLAGTETEDDDNLVSGDQHILKKEDLAGTEKEDDDNLVSDYQLTDKENVDDSMLPKDGSEETSIARSDISANQNRNDGCHFVGIMNANFIATMAGDLYGTKRVKDVTNTNSEKNEDLAETIEKVDEDGLDQDGKRTIKESDRLKSSSAHELALGKENKSVEQSTDTTVSIEPKHRIHSSSKIPFGKKTSWTNNYSKDSRTVGGKFNTKLDGLHRKNNKINTNIQASENRAGQVQEEKRKTEITHSQKVPLWKIHSKDFMRKRVVNKTRDSNNKLCPPTKNVAKRLPLRDCLNEKVESISPTKNSIKKAPLKSMPMSKRNEEQMKKYVERQSKGRKYRAEKEQVKMYAHYVRNPVPGALNQI